MSKTNPIALALSGGGVRAMAFHLGVLRRLADHRVFERIEKVSTVSAGSLLVGLIVNECQLQWPTSDQFVTHVYSSIRNQLCEKSLQWGSLRQLLKPWNCRFILSRANLLALALREEWGVNAKLSELPEVPEWSINGTTAENGKRFRFKRENIGDYTIGYARASDFSLANALAVSAAFPGGFGPLTLKSGAFEWRKREWEAPPGSEVPVKVSFRKLHLYDGGVYDNLGLEPLFDAGRGTAKHPGYSIIASDGGATLPSGFEFMALNPFRLKRVADIMSAQSNALRTRTFVNYLQQQRGRGCFIHIATPVDGSSNCASAKFASSFPTTLRKLTEKDFDKIADHGYRVAGKVESLYGSLSGAA